LKSRPEDHVQALQLIRFGDPLDSVSLVSRQTRQPDAGELLIEMHAAPIHPSDIHLIRGFYGLRPELPLDLGADGVGTVVEAGSAADREPIGRRAILIPTYRHGTWTQKTVAKTNDTVVVDDQTDLMQLAMLGVTPVTAQLLLTKFQQLQPGDWIAQTAANSSVGQYIIQLARIAQVHTVNLVRREAAATEALAAGGDVTIIVDDDLAERLQDALGPTELALVLDSVGGPAIAELAHHLRYGGKVVTYGALGGQRTEIEVRRDLIYRDLSHHGFWMNNWLNRAPREEIDSTYRSIVALVSSGQLTARIGETFPLSRYKEALTRAEQYKRAGKILFCPN
jgi:NADPH:quinone reductase-like Zn-dependent oxidoreductase